MHQIDIEFLGLRLKAKGLAGIIGAIAVLAIVLAYAMMTA